jgi:hypothetical protein
MIQVQLLPPVVSQLEVCSLGVGVHIVVLHLFVGGCACRSQRRECIVVDSGTEVLRCSASGVGEGIRGDVIRDRQSRGIGAREGNVAFVSCDRAGHPVAKWTTDLGLRPPVRTSSCMINSRCNPGGEVSFGKRTVTEA